MFRFINSSNFTSQGICGNDLEICVTHSFVINICHLCSQKVKILLRIRFRKKYSRDKGFSDEDKNRVHPVILAAEFDQNESGSKLYQPKIVIFQA